MSQENVELIRVGLDAYNRGDWEAALKYAAPDFVLDMSRSIGPVGGIYTVDQMRQLWGDFDSTFESHRVEAHEFIEADEHVVVPITVHATGRDGIEATANTALVYTLRDGAVTRMAMYQTREDALEAVGLGE
jgi:ketosteroid isomerase-like protein